MHGTDRDVPFGVRGFALEPTHFAVAPNKEHVSLDVERIVEKREDYWVVEKLGEAAEVADQTNPR